MTKQVKHWTLGTAMVKFISPDMNWSDVNKIINPEWNRTLLPDKKHRVLEVLGENSYVQIKPQYLEFLGEVRAWVDLTDTNHNTFCLSGTAKVGMTAEAMNQMFFDVRSYLPESISNDPAVWLLMGESLLPQQCREEMLLIANDEKLTEAFVRRGLFDMSRKVPIVVRYTER